MAKYISGSLFQLRMHEKAQSLAMVLQPWLKKKSIYSFSLSYTFRKGKKKKTFLFSFNYGFLRSHGESQEH